jgi:hypothetical protein
MYFPRATVVNLKLEAEDLTEHPEGVVPLAAAATGFEQIIQLNLNFKALLAIQVPGLATSVFPTVKVPLSDGLTKSLGAVDFDGDTTGGLTWELLSNPLLTPDEPLLDTASPVHPITWLSAS